LNNGHTAESPLTDPPTANIPSNYARLIGRELGLQMFDIPRLLRFTQLTSEQFMQEDMLLTAQQLIQIIDNGSHLSDQPNFGLQLGRRLTPSTHGAMGFLANNSANLLIALKAFQTFLPTRVSFAHLKLEYHHDSVKCYMHFDRDLQPNIHRVLSEIFAVIFYECAEFIVGRPVVEAHVSFTHDEPSYHNCYPDYLPGTYTFAAHDLLVSLPMAICEIPNASANRENYAIAMLQCEAMLAQLNSHKNSYTYQVQKMMLSHPSDDLNEGDAAAALFISKRTLARKLQKEDTSFRQLRDALLSEQASNYLRHSSMSTDAIAALLNYHDSANFRRAFKRWFNISPSAYRQQK
jgi:AraC-like DNA-binding protein